MAAKKKSPETPAKAPDVFTTLRALLAAHAKGLVVTKDTEDIYELYSTVTAPNGKPWYLGAVARRANYVSFHFFPIYVNPGLVGALSPALKKRKQGKSCFNFKAHDPELFAELEGLVDRGVGEFARAGYLGKRKR